MELNETKMLRFIWTCLLVALCHTVVLVAAVHLSPILKLGRNSRGDVNHHRAVVDSDVGQEETALHNARPLPSWPEKWISDWTLYQVTPQDPMPPYTQHVLPEPHTTGKGRTYYDWTQLAIIEEYYDFCVPIFVKGWNFRCNFLNVHNISYFIAFEDRPSWVPECCIFGEPWLPPGPHTIGKELPFLKMMDEINWYRVSQPSGLVFGYGFHSKSGLPAEFFFNGTIGWALQDFFNFSTTTPPQEKWILPKACLNATVCDLPH